MTCPRCHAPDMRVSETRTVSAGIKRRRICDACGHRTTTLEGVLADARQGHPIGDVQLVRRADLEILRETIAAIAPPAPDLVLWPGIGPA